MQNDFFDFNPDVHDKKFVLRELSYVLHWAQYSKSFQTSPLAQDFEILNLEDGKIARLLAVYSPEWAVTPVTQDINVLSKIIDLPYCLSKRSEGWAQSPAAQNIDVLKLDKYLVMENLAHSKTWETTPAAQDLKILSLNGGRAAVILANKLDSVWGGSPAAQNIDVLSLKNGEVARRLAMNSTEWAGTPAAQDQRVLSGDVVLNLAIHSPCWIDTPVAHSKHVLTANDNLFIAFCYSQFKVEKEKYRQILDARFAEILMRFVSAGAFDCLSLKAVLAATQNDGFTVELNEVIEYFNTDALKAFDVELDDSLAILAGPNAFIDKAILLARAAISMQCMTDLFADLSDELCSMSAKYTDSLASLVSAFGTSEQQRLALHCKGSCGQLEQELLTKVSLTKQLIDSLPDSVETSSPTFY